MRELGRVSYIDYIENRNISIEMLLNEKLPSQVRVFSKKLFKLEPRKNVSSGVSFSPLFSALLLCTYQSVSSPRGREGGGGSGNPQEFDCGYIPRVGILIRHHAYDIDLYSRRELRVRGGGGVDGSH